MTKRAGSIAVTALLLLLASCSDEARVILRVNGELAAVATIEVILALPQVEPRPQRSWAMNADGRSAIEDVYYVAQVDEVDTIRLSELGEPRNDQQLVIQLASDAGDLYLPIVVARDDQGTIVGMGVYDPASVFDGDTRSSYVENDRAHVRVYDLTLEPAQNVHAAARTYQPASSVIVATCAGPDDPDARPSGLVWRHSTGAQLRLLLPESPSRSQAEKLLADPDLDCDAHTAGILGPGDPEPQQRLDCDDLDRRVRPGAKEMCNGADDDCDDKVDGFEATSRCDGCGPEIRGVCDESSAAVAGPSFCMGADSGLACKLCRFDVDFMGQPTFSACGGAGQIPLAPCSAAGCTATLIDVAPGWLVEVGLVEGMLVGVNVPIVVSPSSSNSVPVLLLHAEAPDLRWNANESMLGHFTLHVRPANGKPFAWTFQHVPTAVPTGPGPVCPAASYVRCE